MLGKGKRSDSTFNLKAINIIAFDVPFPANYGGVIDVFYKIKSLHQAGIKIHLHCFEYGRGQQKELDKYCESVTYYKRQTGTSSMLSNLPYIVKSRTSKTLKLNLLSNNFPVLFEGLHCCFLLDDPDFKERYKIVRAHNVEHDYYAHLAKNETHKVRQQYYRSETRKLRKFEKIIQHADLCLTISENDLIHFQETYPKLNCMLVPAFHQSDSVNIKEGLGDYVLYHGNLSVNENQKALEFIVDNVFNKLDIPLVVAGLNPDKNSLKLVDKYSHVRLIENLSDKDLNHLIANAQINFLYTAQATGLKLKLLNALHNGRHCVVNSKMVVNSDLATCCEVEDQVKPLRVIMKDLMVKPVSEKSIARRKKVLKRYTNQHLADSIIHQLENVKAWK
ncbi:MAG: glycosyltransferase [Flavobacteriales bacterium]|nr:glycosyltransferase [Flavobacteriales bacterium]